MRIGTNIIMLMLLLLLGCSEEPIDKDSIELGIVSFSVPGNPEVSQVLDRVELKSWKIKFESDSIYLTIYNPEKDTNQYDSELKASISLYDTYLSEIPTERENCLIQKIKSKGINGRIVTRKYSDSTSYIELYYESVCPNDYQVIFKGTNLSKEKYTLMENLYKKVSVKCSD